MYNAEELKKSHALFFEAHDIKLVNEDVGQGILHGRNTYSYDFAPVSSPKGFLHWAKKTCEQLLGPFSFITGVGYIVVYLFLDTSGFAEKTEIIADAKSQ